MNAVRQLEQCMLLHFSKPKHLNSHICINSDSRSSNQTSQMIYENILVMVGEVWRTRCSNGKSVYFALQLTDVWYWVCKWQLFNTGSGNIAYHNHVLYWWWPILFPHVLMNQFTLPLFLCPNTYFTNWLQLHWVDHAAPSFACYWDSASNSHKL